MEITLCKNTNDYWNSILNKINTYYTPLVNEISHKNKNSVCIRVYRTD